MTDTPTDRRHWPALLLFVLTSVGVPAAAINFFKEEMGALPAWGRWTLALLWVAVVFVGAVLTEAWKIQRVRWGKRLADRVDAWSQRLLSRYRRRYLEFLYFQHRNFDVKGLSTQGTYNLELEQVFVELSIVPQPPGRTSADPIRPVPEELRGRRPIWDHLQNEAMADENLVLIGPPGSGKTTLLKMLALQLAARRRCRRHLKHSLPVLLFLREHVAAVVEDGGSSLAEVIAAAVARKKGPEPPPGWWQEQLRAGRCLVLLDGLDEVAAAQIRARMVAWVEDQMQAHARNRFLITSRPHGYRHNPIAGVTVLEVESFSGEQIRRFVFNWYRANEIRASGTLDPGVEMTAREGAEDLLRRLRTAQTLNELAVNPLLLTMIATVHRYRSTLPGRRVELYAEICEVFLGKRQEARGVESDLTPAQKQRVLQPLAHHLMAAEKREIAVDEAVRAIAPTLRRVAGGKAEGTAFLKDVENRSGLLLEREAGVWGFAHLAFQEYLTAVHCQREGLHGELRKKVGDSWWQEVIRLYGAQADATPILEACLSSPRPTVEALTLAIDCVEEAQEVDEKWRERIADFVSRGVEDTDPERFRLAAETLLARRLRDMVAVDESTFVDPTYVSHAEYQLFLDERRAAGSFHQPDHWSVPRFPAGGALDPVVGMRPSDAKTFCQWLSDRHGSWRFRLPRPGELAGYGMHDVTDASVGRAEGYWADSGTATSFERSVDRRHGAGKQYLSELIKRDLSADRKGDINLALALARHFNLDRAPLLAAALDLVRDLARDRDLLRDLARALDLLRDLARARDLLRALDLARTLDLARNLARIRDRAHNLDRAVALDRALDLARARAFGGARARGINRARTGGVGPIIRWSARICLLSLYDQVRVFQSPRVWPWSRRKRGSPLAEDAENLLFLYTDLAILEGRIEGELEAFEGIRLVKERVA